MIPWYYHKAEQASHGLMGQDAGQGEELSLTSALSHGVGYAFTPILGLMEGAVAASRFLAPKEQQALQVELPATKNLTHKVGSSMSQQPRKQEQKRRQPRKPRKPRKPKQQNQQQQQLQRYKMLTAPSRQKQAPPLSKAAIQLGRRSKPKETKVDAPVITGGTRDSGMKMNFKQGRNPGSLAIEGCLFIGDLCSATPASGSAFAVIAQHTDGTKLLNGVTVAPQNYLHFGSPVTVFAQLFERFAMRTDRKSVV